MPNKSGTFKIIDKKTVEVTTPKFHFYVEKRDGAYGIIQFDANIEDHDDALIGSMESEEIPYIINELKMAGVNKVFLTLVKNFLQ